MTKRTAARLWPSWPASDLADERMAGSPMAARLHTGQQALELKLVDNLELCPT
ncbi:MAG: hypothetical protein R2911_24620 [Caldilineaceae bacterium]